MFRSCGDYGAVDHISRACSGLRTYWLVSHVNWHKAPSPVEDKPHLVILVRRARGISHRRDPAGLERAVDLSATCSAEDQSADSGNLRRRLKAAVHSKR